MNANNYVVTRNFTDKTNGETYKIGQSFNAQDQQRVQELESGGYIAAANSTFAQDAQAQAKNAQANAQALANAHMEAANNAEPKTVLGGKVVSLKAAQAAEAAFDESNRQTGIQQHHDNTTESVPAGQVAGDTSQQERAYYEQQKQAAQMATINATNLQSGQSGVQEHLQQAEQNLQQAQQQLQNQMQQAQGQQQSSQQQQQAERQALAAAAEKTNPMAAEHETAAEMQAEAAQATAKARARAKKE